MKIDFNKPILERPHNLFNEGGVGVQKIWKFKNGYGASVVRFSLPKIFPKSLLLRPDGRGREYGSYTNNEDEWELAVIRFRKDDKTEEGEPSFDIDYNTKITNDVIGYLKEKEVLEILKKISKLKELKRDIKSE